MIRVEHLSIHDHKETILEDVSFELASKGFVSFCAEEKASRAMAKLLGAQCYPKYGSVYFQDNPLNKVAITKGILRNTFVQGLFGDFQLLMNQSVYENATLGFAYPKADVEQLLSEWHLIDKKRVAVEDLEFEDQAAVVIVRCLLRRCQMIVYDVYSSPFSQKERIQLYQLLKKCSQQLLVVVCGDFEANAFADHILECRKAYLVSDSLHQIAHEHIIEPRVFHMPAIKKKAIWRDINQRSLWKFRVLFLCLLCSVIAINVVMFNSQLHLVDLEESVLSSFHQNMIQIEKQAVGDGGKIYPNYYADMEESDGEALSKHLKGNLIYSYKIENPEQEMNRFYGTKWNPDDLYTYHLIELKNENQGFHQIQGHFPKNYFEACISSVSAKSLLRSGYFEGLDENSDVSKVIGKEILWYGRTLTISGILSIDDNPNLGIQIQRIDENDSKYIDQLYTGNLFVKAGFMKNHDASKQTTFPDVVKQLTYQNRSVPLTQIQYPKNEIAFFNGETFLSDIHLKDDEAYLDFYAVYQLIYHDRYRDVKVNDDMSLEEKMNDYYHFASELIGKEVTVNAYRINREPGNSMIMNKTVKIKGIMTIGDYIFSDDFFPESGSGKIMMSASFLQPYMKANYKIDKLFYQSNQKEEMLDALRYLNTNAYYQAFVSNSRMFQVFVVDIKELRGVLLFIGVTFFMIYMIGFLYLIDRNRRTNQKEMTIYYLFGDTKQHLELLYARNTTFNLLKHHMFAMIASLICIYILIFLVYKDFTNVEIPMISYISIPVLFMLASWVISSIIAYFFIKLRRILDECVQHDRNMLQ